MQRARGPANNLIPSGLLARVLLVNRFCENFFLEKYLYDVKQVPE